MRGVSAIAGAALAGLAVSLAAAQEILGGLDVQAERTRIAQERRQELARQHDVEAGCYKKFAVQGCLNASRAQHRQVMDDLRRQEVLLNDQERRLRGAEQLRKIEEKTSTAREDLSAPAAAARHPRPPATAQQDQDKAANAAQQERERLDRVAAQRNKQAEHERVMVQRQEKALQAPQERAAYDKKRQEVLEARKAAEERRREGASRRAPALPAP